MSVVWFAEGVILRCWLMCADAEAKYRALEEETRLRNEGNDSSIAMLTDMLEETQTELERYKSSKIVGRLEQRRALLRQMSLDHEASTTTTRPTSAATSP